MKVSPNQRCQPVPFLLTANNHGFVVAPPSLHKSGKEYSWAMDPRVVHLADCPAWLCNGCRQIIKKNKTTTGDIPEGQRNDQLAEIAGAMRRQGCDYDVIAETLQKVNQKRCYPPLDAEEVQNIAKSVCNYKPKRKRFRLTDAGNGQRFAQQHNHRIKYCWDWGKWLVWDGKRWNTLKGEEIAFRCSVQTARKIAREADNADSEERKAILKWSYQSENTTRLSAMLTAAKAMKAISTYADDFDRDPFLLNCLNGTIDLRTGKIRPHKTEDMITRLAPVVYDHNAKSKLWTDFLETITKGDKAVQTFLQIAFGYSASGDTTEEKLFFIYGPTASGKSTILEAVKAVLGDYAATADFETFLHRSQAGGARNDIARLHSARLVVSIEVEQGQKLAEGLVKMLTGGDTIAARFLYKESFEFKPQCKLWLAANDCPRASDVDEALWRRILRVPFEHSIPEDERDPKVKAKLRNTEKSGPAILVWIVKGAARWHKEGLLIPDRIKQSTMQYRQEQDPLLDFFEDKCWFDDDRNIPVTELRKVYQEYCNEMGIRYPLGPKQFNRRLESRGCHRKTKKVPNDAGTMKVQKCWVGIELKPEEVTDFCEDEDDDECDVPI